MNSRKRLFAILAGTALTTVAGILLSSYQDSSKRKKNGDKLNGKVFKAEEAIEETFSDAKKQINTLDEDIERMVNEGGKVV